MDGSVSYPPFIWRIGPSVSTTALLVKTLQWLTKNTYFHDKVEMNNINGETARNRK
jgi:hypothetical protein